MILWGKSSIAAKPMAPFSPLSGPLTNRLFKSRLHCCASNLKSKIANARNELMQPETMTLMKMLARAPARGLPDIIQALKNLGSYRKSSRMLSSHLMMDMLELVEPRMLVLTGALYLEHITTRWMKNSPRGTASRSLALRVKAMLDKRELDLVLHDDIQAVVKLRNHYVHELYFSLADWDLTTSPLLKGANPLLPKSRTMRAAKNLVLFKFLMIDIGIRLQKALPWLTLEDVPPAARMRANKLLKLSEGKSLQNNGKA